MKLKVGDHKFLVRKKDIDDLMVDMQPYFEVIVDEIEEERDTLFSKYIVKFRYALYENDHCTLYYGAATESYGCGILVLTDPLSDYYLFDSENEAIDFLKYYLRSKMDDYESNVKTLKGCIERTAEYIQKNIIEREKLIEKTKAQTEHEPEKRYEIFVYDWFVKNSEDGSKVDNAVKDAYSGNYGKVLNMTITPILDEHGLAKSYHIVFAAECCDCDDVTWDAFANDSEDVENHKEEASEDTVINHIRKCK